MGTLISSISGIRGIVGSGLDPDVLVRYAGAFGSWVREGAEARGEEPLVIVGRDARVSGPMVSRVVIGTLQATGCSVIDAGLATTPTVEMAVAQEGAHGGVIFSASHNPAEWNALKLLNGRGEFLTPEEASSLFERVETGAPAWSDFERLGSLRSHDYLAAHIDAIVDLPYVDLELIRERRFRVVVDGVNSVGGLAIPALLGRLGAEVVEMNCEATGRFAHPAEPLEKHLGDLVARVAEEDADLGVAVDPDADRLALVADGGTYLNEELTQVVAADLIWEHESGPFATNLSSSRAIEVVAERHGEAVHRSAVGEINVVEKMKEVDAVIGGEGNGGVILPALHYGRDALAGVALTLQLLAERETTLSAWRAEMPSFVMAKDKLPLGEMDAPALLNRMAEHYRDEQISTVDGLKIDFEEGWVHMRPSNTEPILRVYAEAGSAEEAQQLADRFKKELQKI